MAVVFVGSDGQRHIVKLVCEETNERLEGRVFIVDLVLAACPSHNPRLAHMSLEDNLGDIGQLGSHFYCPCVLYGTNIIFSLQAPCTACASGSSVLPQRNLCVVVTEDDL